MPPSSNIRILSVGWTVLPLQEVRFLEHPWPLVSEPRALLPQRFKHCVCRARRDSSFRIMLEMQHREGRMLAAVLSVFQKQLMTADTSISSKSVFSPLLSGHSGGR